MITHTSSSQSASSNESIHKRQKISSDCDYEIAKITTWRDGYGSISSDKHSRKRRLPLVDLRSKEAYSKHHLKDSSKSSLIVHLPFEDLLSGERSCELPPRHVEFSILVPSNFAMDQIQDFFFATQSKATSQSRKPWLVRQLVQEDDALWHDAKKMGILSSSDSDEVDLPLPRLWKPDNMIADVLLPLLRQKLDEDCEHDFVVWDLGSGAGRDVSFLAEEFKHQACTKKSGKKVKVVGFDNHKGSARRSLPLWKNRLVDDITISRLVNLKNMEVFEKNILEENGKLICLYAIRYLNRRMIDYIASSEGVFKPGCLFAMSHFCKEKGSEWNWDHPKPSNVLDRNELRDRFQPEKGWKIIFDDIALDNDHGRPLNHFIAEKL